MGRLILASASPRRADLLTEAGLAFEVRAADVDESFDPSREPLEVARDLALRKARVVAAGLGAEPAWVLGGDTLVVLDGPVFLGKPVDAVEARAMLEALSGSVHRVITGVAVVRTGPDGEGAELAAAEVTEVTMRAITPDEVAAYVASGEWRGKAGGYAIQETADRFVTGLAGGGFDNVVGLPVALSLELLERLDLDPLPGGR